MGPDETNTAEPLRPAPPRPASFAPIIHILAARLASAYIRGAILGLGARREAPEGVRVRRGEGQVRHQGGGLRAFQGVGEVGGSVGRCGEGERAKLERCIP